MKVQSPRHPYAIAAVRCSGGDGEVLAIQHFGPLSVSVEVERNRRAGRRDSCGMRQWPAPFQITTYGDTEWSGTRLMRIQSLSRSTSPSRCMTVAQQYFLTEFRWHISAQLTASSTGTASGRPTKMPFQVSRLMTTALSAWTDSPPGERPHPSSLLDTLHFPSSPGPTTWRMVA